MFFHMFLENIKNLGYMFTSAKWEIIQNLEKNMCISCFYFRGCVLLTSLVFMASAN